MKRQRTGIVTEFSEFQLRSLESITQSNLKSLERQNQREKDSVKDYGFQNLELHNHLSKVNENTRDYLPGRYCNGVMGVPITFLDKFNADQFKISGCADANVLPDGWRGASKEFVELYYKQGNTGTWLANAKNYFSKRNCVARQMADGYIKGNPIRQDYLEKVLT